MQLVHWFWAAKLTFIQPPSPGPNSYTQPAGVLRRRRHPARRPVPVMFGSSWTASSEQAHARSCCTQSRLEAQAVRGPPRHQWLQGLQTARQRPLTTAQAQHEQKHAVVGIDLGTTNSAIAVRQLCSSGQLPVQRSLACAHLISSCFAGRHQRGAPDHRVRWKPNDPVRGVVSGRRLCAGRT